MKAKTDQWIESNIYREKVEGMLKHLRSASVVDKMTVRRFISQHTDDHGKMCMDTGVMAMILAVIEL